LICYLNFSSVFPTLYSSYLFIRFPFLFVLSKSQLLAISNLRIKYSYPVCLYNFCFCCVYINFLSEFNLTLQLALMFSGREHCHTKTTSRVPCKYVPKTLTANVSFESNYFTWNMSHYFTFYAVTIFTPIQNV